MPDQNGHKTLEEQEANWCRHYRGHAMLSSATCGAGVPYDSVCVSVPRGSPFRWPCFREDGVSEVCPRTSYPTPEEVQAEVARTAAALR